MTSRKHRERFEALLREHAAAVSHVARAYSRGREERLDLEQEIAIQLWRAFPRFDPARAKVSTWLYRIALNVAISHLRREQARPQRLFQPLQAEHLETVRGAGIDEPDPRVDRLHAAIHALDPLDRALVLLYLEDRSHAEIAQVLGISQTNVATKLGRIRQTLRGRLVAETDGA